MTLTLRPLNSWFDTDETAVFDYTPHVAVKRSYIPLSRTGEKDSDQSDGRCHCAYCRAAHSQTLFTDFEFVLAKADTPRKERQWLVIAGCRRYTIEHYRRHTETYLDDEAPKKAATLAILDAFEVWIKDHTS